MLLLSLVAAGALLIFVQLLLILRTASARHLARRTRLLALLPPCTPVVAWRAGNRWGALLWGAAFLVYAALFWLA